MDGEYAGGAFAGQEGRELVDGVPEVVAGHEAGDVSVDVFGGEVREVLAEDSDLVLWDEEGDADAGRQLVGVGGVPVAVVKGYLSQSTVGVTEYAEVDEDVHG